MFFLFFNTVNMFFLFNKPKKIITFSPSGLSGFYLLGVASYLKETYYLDDFIFSGCSSGAWISLLLSYKGEHKKIINNILNISIKSQQNVKLLSTNIKNELLLNYNTKDFNLDNVYIGTTHVDNFSFKFIIYNDFNSLEQIINCCIASSFIPYIIDDKPYFIYNNKKIIDGGFSELSYFYNNSILNVNMNLWKQKQSLTKIEQFINQIKLFTELLAINKTNLTELYLQGYLDAKSNTHILDFSLYKYKKNFFKYLKY